MRLTDLYVNRPCLMLAITLGFSLVISAIVGAAGGIALNDQTNRDYLIWSSERVEHFDMYNLAIDFYDEAT